MSSRNETDVAKEDELYYDTLYNFAKVAVNANDMALDGYTTNQIAKKLQQSAEAFCLLCKADLKENVSAAEEKKEVTPEQMEEKKIEPLPDNFIQEKDGWGLCPVCRKKIVKLTNTTKLVNYPAYCKSCKTEYIVNWWNVENKNIIYTRYVNNKHFIDRQDIRSEGMKGTGVQNFANTRTSATERVAMRLH